MQQPGCFPHNMQHNTESPGSGHSDSIHNQRTRPQRRSRKAGSSHTFRHRVQRLVLVRRLAGPCTSHRGAKLTASVPVNSEPHSVVVVLMPWFPKPDQREAHHNANDVLIPRDQSPSRCAVAVSLQHKLPKDYAHGHAKVSMPEIHTQTQIQLGSWRLSELS